MQATISSKGQIVLPAPLRRQLGLGRRSKVFIEEREGGIFIRPAKPATGIAPIEYLAPGVIVLSPQDYEFDRIAGEDEGPEA